VVEKSEGMCSQYHTDGNYPANATSIIGENAAEKYVIVQ
jgi:hypothetical protein